MAVKYRGEFVSEKGVAYRVEIHDTTYFGLDVYNFDVLNLAVKYDANGEEDDRFTPVIQSEASVEMHIDNSDLNAFVEDLVTSGENKYYILIYDVVQPLQSFTFRWAGYILTDLIAIEDVDLNLGYSFVLKAKDGLNTLKNIDYNNSGVPYTGKATIFSHLDNCFKKLGWILFAYASLSDYLFAAVINWHGGEYTYNSTNTVLTKARIPHRAFFHRDTKGNYVYKSCFDVLSEICKTFGCRIIHSGTGYHIVQINEYLNANSVYEYRSGLLSGFTGATRDYTIDHDQTNPDTTDVYRLANGFFEFFSPLQYTRVEYEHIATRNLLAGALWNYNDESAKVAEDIESNNLESILQLEFSVIYKTAFTQVVGTSLRQPHYVIMRMEFKIDTPGAGTQYYQNIFNRQYNQNQFFPPFWSSTPGYYYFGLPKVLNEGEFIENIQFIINRIPADGDLSVKIEFYNIYPSSGIDPLPSNLQGGSVPILQDYYTLTYEASNTFLQYIHTGFFNDQNDIIRFEANNDTAAYKTKTTETIIGDGPNLNSPGHLEVRNDSNDWVLSEIGWKVGNTGTAKNISQLLANEQIKGQLLPVRKFAQTTFVMNAPKTAFLQPHYAINYDGAYWVFHGGVYDLYRDMVTGTWWKIKVDS